MDGLEGSKKKAEGETPYFFRVMCREGMAEAHCGQGSCPFSGKVSLSLGDPVENGRLT